MIRLVTCILLSCFADRATAQNTAKEKLAMAYYAGFEKHDWNTVAAQFAEGFSFTSPNNDNHISIDKFKAKCWPTNQFFRKVNFVSMTEKGDTLFLLVEITTTDNDIVRNVDMFTFSGAKIKSIETFFGAGTKYPGNGK